MNFFLIQVHIQHINRKSQEKEKSSYGSIFINSNCNIKKDVIYGNDMKDVQMFKDLLKYQDKDFYDKHTTLKIATDEREEEYEIIYTFKSRIFY